MESRFRKRIFIVRDTHQQIYSFRYYAIDTMKRFSCDDRRDLTLSFRFGKKIADLASVFIREAKGEKGFGSKGNLEKKSRMAFYANPPRPKAGERCAILSRTNLALFEHALGLRRTGIPFSLQGNISGILGRISVDLCWLSEGTRGKIRGPFIRPFEDLEGLETCAQRPGRFPVRQHGRSGQGICPDPPGRRLRHHEDLEEHGRQPEWSRHHPLHGAKGQEYDRIYIAADIAASLSRPEALVTPTFGDEANIAYLAFTRAIRQPYLPPDFKDILTPEWQAALERFEPPPPKIAHAPRPKPARTELRAHSATRSTPSPAKAPEPNPLSKKRFKVGDKVKTSTAQGRSSRSMARSIWWIWMGREPNFGQRIGRFEKPEGGISISIKTFLIHQTRRIRILCGFFILVLVRVRTSR